MSAAAAALWLRAALRLPLFGYVVFYLAHGVDMRPDGAVSIFLLYHVAEIDTVVWVACGYLVELVSTGWEWPGGMALWLVAYAGVSVSYAVVGLLVWRGSPLVRRHYRGGLGYLMLEAGLRVLSLLVVVPGAVSALDTGENAGTDDYFGRDLVHLYEGFLLPWVLTLSTATVAVVVLLRTRSARRYLRRDDARPARPAPV